MRVLSVDIPWGGDRFLGLAWTDAADPRDRIHSAVSRAPGPLESKAGWRWVRDRIGAPCDLLLLDQPLGLSVPGLDPRSKACRTVEIAWGNRFFCTSAAGARIQFPRFQPGHEHASAGVLRARAALAALGSGSAVAVESFPQLTVPALLRAAFQDAPADAVVSLAAHKARTPRALRIRAQEQLVRLIERFTGRELVWPASIRYGQAGSPDIVDAALGLVTGLGWAGALPAGAPPAVRLTQPRMAARKPPSREDLSAAGSAWWSPAPGELASGRRTVRTNGIAALRWW